MPMSGNSGNSTTQEMPVVEEEQEEEDKDCSSSSNLSLLALESPYSRQEKEKCKSPEHKEKILASVDSSEINEPGFVHATSPSFVHDDDADANEWFMQDVLVHLAGAECKTGIVTNVDGTMLTVTFVGGQVQTFSREDLACRVAKANALRGPHEYDLNAIIVTAMEEGNSASLPTRDPSVSYSDMSEKSSVQTPQVQIPHRRRGRLDSSARHLDLKPTFKGSSRGEMNTRDVNACVQTSGERGDGYAQILILVEMYLACRTVYVGLTVF